MAQFNREREKNRGNMFCTKCGSSNSDSAGFCRTCGLKFESSGLQPDQTQAHAQPAPIIVNTVVSNSAQMVNVEIPADSKSRVLAGVLAILAGSIGVHKFYLGKPFQGVLYLAFCWTFIPMLLGIIEGIAYLMMSNYAFFRKYG